MCFLLCKRCCLLRVHAGQVVGQITASGCFVPRTLLAYLDYHAVPHSKHAFCASLALLPGCAAAKRPCMVPVAVLL